MKMYICVQFHIKKQITGRNQTGRMKSIYIDCTAGISGDMLLRALQELAGQYEHHKAHQHEHHEGHEHGHGHHHHHGRSYEEVKAIIDRGFYTEKARAYAQSIYAVIAKAEASVHEKTLETVHFHEVGRDQAILNALGIGQTLDRIGIDEAAGDQILVSAICDGTGFVDCAHGRIPVPVPAVRAIMDDCQRTGKGYDFQTCEDVETEMVTPSGLASIVGIGAIPAPKGFTIMGSIIGETEIKGTRDTGRGGLRAYLIEK